MRLRACIDRRGGGSGTGARMSLRLLSKADGERISGVLLVSARSRTVPERRDQDLQWFAERRGRELRVLPELRINGARDHRHEENCRFFEGSTSSITECTKRFNSTQYRYRYKLS